jgi:hypothetical protein
MKRRIMFVHLRTGALGTLDAELVVIPYRATRSLSFIYFVLTLFHHAVICFLEKLETGRFQVATP